MSRAFFKPSAVPALLRSFPRRKTTDEPVSTAAGTPRTATSVDRLPLNERDGQPPSIEVWSTTCVVTNFGLGGAGGGPRCSVLVNPANPDLCGVSNFPYFPRGGPVPKRKPNVEAHHIMGYVSSWGGMEVGTG
eukprot:CAMPEP_0183294958 /NCGR_PEP_ID=MMETSP0160_2-20130417/3089_1 /TAXON_ID=2839 ORGANISM="Odontella Sinensis, Strain Grunow 1884" /NCGR_SAMPLE_ID=MMETSP0160_2 /ASSEMBLY_ACC=CAM_ASM_000250 /LENGTH=132 /DNA_ID=CAMNT_0025456351 /DNA_START=36 /DNA_END=430 /DNA_ORIENTATION=-